MHCASVLYKSGRNRILSNTTTPLAVFMTIKLQCFVSVYVDKRMRRYEYGYCCTYKEIMCLVPEWTIGWPSAYPKTLVTTILKKVYKINL